MAGEAVARFRIVLGVGDHAGGMMRRMASAIRPIRQPERQGGKVNPAVDAADHVWMAVNRLVLQRSLPGDQPSAEPDQHGKRTLRVNRDKRERAGVDQDGDGERG